MLFVGTALRIALTLVQKMKFVVLLLLATLHRARSEEIFPLGMFIARHGHLYSSTHSGFSSHLQFAVLLRSAASCNTYIKSALRLAIA